MVGGGGYPTSVLAKNDGRIFEHNDIGAAEFMPELYRVLRSGGDCYVMTNNLNLREYLNVAYEVGFGLHNLLAWQKNTCNANRWYMKELEWVLYFYKAPAQTINKPSSKQVFVCDNPQNKVHPTEKPVPLFEHYILNSSAPGDLVLDPFVGSGSAGLAALNTDRRFFGIELDPAYFAIAEKRLRQPLWRPSPAQQVDMFEAIA
jgi:DNA modification methylase